MSGGDLPAEQVIEETKAAGASKMGGGGGGSGGGDCGPVGGDGGDFKEGDGVAVGGGEPRGDGGGGGGGDGGAVGGDQGGVGGGRGGDFGRRARNTLVNYSGGFNQVNYLGGGRRGGGSGGTVGGSWGQGHHGRLAEIRGGLGQVWTSPAAPHVVQDWNYFLNSVVNYSFWNGYPLPNYGLTTNLGGPQRPSMAPSTTGGTGGGARRSSDGKNSGEKFSRKVFIGGLPPDIDEVEIIESFQYFGPVVVDWPRKSQSTAYFPPKGYAFLLFQREASVKLLIDACVRGQGQGQKLFYFLDSPTIKAKRVEVRPWRLSDANFWVRSGAWDLEMKTSEILDENRLMAFVGGVPRPLKAVELARLMDNVFGGVCYAGVNCDRGFKYPKGCGRVGFSSKESYEAAVEQRFVWIRYGNGYKQVEVKPYVRAT